VLFVDSALEGRAFLEFAERTAHALIQKKDIKNFRVHVDGITPWKSEIMRLSLEASGVIVDRAEEDGGLPKTFFIGTGKRKKEFFIGDLKKVWTEFSRLQTASRFGVSVDEKEHYNLREPGVRLTDFFEAMSREHQQARKASPLPAFWIAFENEFPKTHNKNPKMRCKEDFAAHVKGENYSNVLVLPKGGRVEKNVIREQMSLGYA